MKTPMQELIEQLSEKHREYINNKSSDEWFQNVAYGLEIAVSITNQMLEKEKEVIIQTSVNAYTAGYLDNQAKVDDSMNFPEEYYNETFNTKEK